MSTGQAQHGGVRAYDDVLGYLLKHAHLALEQHTDAALADAGVTTRELGVLRVVADAQARSQQEIGALLGIDRTSMVAFVDSFERRQLVVRRPSEHDRRRNIVELTAAGRALFAKAERCAERAERAFAAPLGEHDAARLRQALQTMLAAHHRA